MNILDPRCGAVDADMLARRNTRLLLGALAQMTGFTLIIGPLALNQVREAIRRMGAKRGNAATLHSHYDIWLERATSARVVRIVTGEELSDHQHRNPIHRWVEYTWEALQGDEDDVEHVCVALACGAGFVLTGNMTCIDSDRLATAAAEADLNVPLVLKRDRCRVSMDVNEPPVRMRSQPEQRAEGQINKAMTP